MTDLEAKKLVAVLVAAFPTTKATMDTVGIYTRMLADLEYPAANAAVEQLLAISKWMPTVAEIRERALSLSVGDVKPGGEAWGLVLKAIRRYGYMRTPGIDFSFDDATTAECVSAMNWQELCNSENPTADRARFIELYDALAVQHRRKQLSEGLPAMQRFRMLQAKRRADALAPPAAEPEPRSLAQILKLVAAPDGES